jgi:RNA polymerase sigma factor (sigma-70 family)
LKHADDSTENSMKTDATVHLQALIDRMRQGDRQAARELLERAHTRLRKLANRMLTGSFPALKGSHDLDSVVDEAWMRLAQAVEKAGPPTVADFFRLAAHKIRQVLLDMADRQHRHQRRETTTAEDSTASDRLAEASDQTYDPSRLALWSELHEKVATLPEPERAVFEMHYYLGIPQSEIALLLDLHPRRVSYLWVAATDKLARYLREAEGTL